MNCTKKSEVGDKAGIKDDLYFIEDFGGSDEEEEFNYGHRSSIKQTAQLGEGSPPLLLSFPITSGRTQQNTSSVSSQEEEGGSNLPVEEWMILGGEEQEEDSNILLNLSSWSSSEDVFGDKDEPEEKPVPDIWAVSEKDRYGSAQSLALRYFIPGRSSICYVCNKAGHFAKHCTSEKSPTCVLCGIQGHIQRDCPGRPCPHCGLPSHSLDPCRVPPVWKQHCQRCGATGHLTDACPDTWRQYHLTVKLEVPFKPRTACSLKQKSHRAHCYNCSKRGHHGFECTRRRMISGTFPSLPYVCHYDTVEDILQRGSRMHTLTKKLVSAGSLPSSERTEDCGEMKGRSRKKQEAAGRRKTWPERRRERREVKRLRREARVRREGGGLPRRSRCGLDGEVCPADPFGHEQLVPPPKKKRKAEKDGQKSRRSREAERWRKRGGLKRGGL
ncbi:zinc finger CCHC domain-containing protein 7 isoform X2 [Kryptolebias marmoratus]|uniref:zinc finger CCHC domain-containing protein 7 isoform X2 n=1 Tax=Kryptolebias marmoratus TaxID=37003 RepID=UPI000D530ACA|nr:zinc finger CCHC domain-containing protein 7 isoform X2 [Kryptolebias marmoratus]